MLCWLLDTDLFKDAEKVKLKWSLNLEGLTDWRILNSKVIWKPWCYNAWQELLLISRAWVDTSRAAIIFHAAQQNSKYWKCSFLTICLFLFNLMIVNGLRSFHFILRARWLGCKLSIALFNLKYVADSWTLKERRADPLKENHFIFV